jgi:hypothetical protein
MNRLGVVLGAVAAFVMFMIGMAANGWGDRNDPTVSWVLVLSFSAGLIVWLVVLGLGWAIQGFQRPV